MNERLLHFIWQYQYFKKGQLQTTDGEPLSIVFPGRYNTDQGPDFLEGKIRISTTLLVGNIELHVLSSDWKKHGHAGDDNYKNIILHIVWQYNEPAVNYAGLPLTTLELQPYVSSLLLSRYQYLMQSQTQQVPCAGLLEKVSPVIWMSWTERLAAERLEAKSAKIIQMLKSVNGHWEEIFWQKLARNFGYSVNADAFEMIAASIPVTLLAKNKSSILAIEALLLGQANFLNKSFSDNYPETLRKEYIFLKKKYQLTPISIPVYLSRMRPGNFPTIRLVQLAQIIIRSSHLLAWMIDIDDYKEAYRLFEDIRPSEYWQTHYILDGEETKPASKTIGRQMIENIFINTICPILFAYGQAHNAIPIKDKAISWLQRTSPEQNKIIKMWTRIGMTSRNAFETQALLQLYNNYCAEYRCLQCSIGNAILKV